MKKYILGAVFSIGIIVSPAFAHQVKAADFDSCETNAIIQLLQAFEADPSVLINVQTTLGTPTTGVDQSGNVCQPIVLSTSGNGGTQTTVVGPSFDTNKAVDVFLIAGQSNAVGYGNATQSPTPPAKKVLSFYKKTISEATDPVGNASAGSAWPAFGTAYYNATGRAVVFVPSAVPGSGQTAVSDTGTGNWDTSGTLFNTSVNNLNVAMSTLSSSGYTPTFKGVLWDQGENDAIAINKGFVTADEYQAALVKMIGQYRTQYGSSMPFFIFQTGTSPTESDVGYAAVRAVQAQVPNINPYTRIVFQGAVSFPSRGMMKDVYHYTQAGYNEMGRIGAQNIVVSDVVSTTPIVQNSSTQTLLKSNFLKDDQTAESIASGQITNYDITTYSTVFSPFDTTSFAYRFVSALRMLGYTASFMSGNTAEAFLNNFEKANGYAQSSLITKQIIIDVDSKLVQVEARDSALANSFPLYKYYINAPTNEPPKEHAAALFSTAFKNLPSSLVTWSEQGFLDYLSNQQPARIISPKMGTGSYSVCDSTMYQETRDTCKVDPAINYVYSYSNDFDDANLLLHEYAHYIDGNIFAKGAGVSRGIIDTTGFYGISYNVSSMKIASNGWKSYTYKNPTNIQNELVSAYAQGWSVDHTPGYYTAQEDFAESFAMYVTQGKVFRALAVTNSVLKQKYEWLKQNVFNGTEYATGADNALSAVRNNSNHGLNLGASTGVFNVEEFSLAIPGFVWNFSFPVGVVTPLATAPTVTSSFNPSTISSTGSTVYRYDSQNTTHCVASHSDGTGGWDNIITNASFPPTTFTAASYPNGLTTTITCYNSAGQSAVSTAVLTVTVAAVTTCTSWSYGSFGSCQSNNTQTRSVTSSYPSGCTGGSPVVTQGCTYVPLATPTIDSFIASAYSISRGMFSMLSYSTSNIPSSATCSINNGVGSIIPNTTGTKTVFPTTSTTYTLSCTEGTSKTVTITVSSGTISASTSSCTIPAGSSSCTVSLNWTITGATDPKITNSSDSVYNNLYTSGSSGTVAGTVKTVGSTLFGIYDGGASLGSVIVSATCASGSSWVNGSCQVVPTVTSSFSPSTISPTGSTVYRYDSQNTTHCVASHPGETGGWDNIITNASFPPTTFSASQFPTGLTTTITCYNAAGQSAVSTAVLTVTNQGASAYDAYSSASNGAKNSEMFPSQSSGDTSAFHYVWNNNLQIGSSYTKDVKALQTALTHEGLYAGEISGGFYSQTFIAVKAFQQKYGIDTGTNGAGFVGLKTRTKLNTLY